MQERGKIWGECEIEGEEGEGIQEREGRKGSGNSVFFLRDNYC